MTRLCLHVTHVLFANSSHMAKPREPEKDGFPCFQERRGNYLWVVLTSAHVLCSFRKLSWAGPLQIGIKVSRLRFECYMRSHLVVLHDPGQIHLTSWERQYLHLQHEDANLCLAGTVWGSDEILQEKGTWTRKAKDLRCVYLLLPWVSWEPVSGCSSI